MNTHDCILDDLRIPATNPCADDYGEVAGCHKTYERDIDTINSEHYGEAETVSRLCR